MIIEISYFWSSPRTQHATSTTNLQSFLFYYKIPNKTNYLNITLLKNIQSLSAAAPFACTTFLWLATDPAAATTELLGQGRQKQAQEKRRLVTSLITRELNIFTRSPGTYTPYKDHNGGGASVLIRWGRASRRARWRGARGRMGEHHYSSLEGAAWYFSEVFLCRAIKLLLWSRYNNLLLKTNVKNSLLISPTQQFLFQQNKL